MGNGRMSIYDVMVSWKYSWDWGHLYIISEGIGKCSLGRHSRQWKV